MISLNTVTDKRMQYLPPGSNNTQVTTQGQNANSIFDKANIDTITNNSLANNRDLANNKDLTDIITRTVNSVVSDILGKLGININNNNGPTANVANTANPAANAPKPPTSPEDMLAQARIIAQNCPNKAEADKALQELQTALTDKNPANHMAAFDKFKTSMGVPPAGAPGTPGAPKADVQNPTAAPTTYANNLANTNVNVNTNAISGINLSNANGGVFDTGNIATPVLPPNPSLDNVFGQVDKFISDLNSGKYPQTKDPATGLPVNQNQQQQPNAQIPTFQNPNQQIPNQQFNPYQQVPNQQFNPYQQNAQQPNLQDPNFLMGIYNNLMALMANLQGQGVK